MLSFLIFPGREGCEGWMPVPKDALRYGFGGESIGKDHS
jgi:hypothetical protein